VADVPLNPVSLLATVALLGFTGVAGHTAVASPPKPVVVAPAPVPVPAPVPSPGQVLSLNGLWKLTLPVASNGDAEEIDPTVLGVFSDPYWFHTTADGGVAFAAPVNGVTTSGSGYPRSELREMQANGRLASWNGKTGTSTLVVDEAFTALPAVKPQVVGAQIHDAHNDWTTIRLEGSKLWVTQGNNTHYRLITASYVLGTRFVAKLVVAAKKVSVFYNGALVATMSAAGLKSAYFRAGAYVQANCSNSSPCSAANYGETTIYSVAATHTP
jgi:hypothetical protein